MYTPLPIAATGLIVEANHGSGCTNMTCTALVAGPTVANSSYRVLPRGAQYGLLRRLSAERARPRGWCSVYHGVFVCTAISYLAV
jgi:hypothetical protein